MIKNSRTILLLAILAGTFAASWIIPIKDEYMFIGRRVEDSQTNGPVPNAIVYFNNGPKTHPIEVAFASDKVRGMSFWTTNSDGICGHVVRYNPTGTTFSSENEYDICIVADNYKVTYGSYKDSPRFLRPVEFRPSFKLPNGKTCYPELWLRTIKLERISQ